MAKVRFYELSPAKELLAIQEKINGQLEAEGYTATVKLMRDRSGNVGYSIDGVTPAGGKKILEAIHRIVCAALGCVRGRPRAEEPTRQVKCRLPESVYRRLEKAAKKRDMTTSRLLAELATKHVA